MPNGILTLTPGASSVATGIQALTAGLSNVALITPTGIFGYQGIDPNGNLVSPTFLFHTEGENKAELRTDITDHFTETNDAIQDHAALPPIKIMVHGFIGELNDVLPINNPILTALSSNLTPLSIFEPGISVTAQNALNEAATAYVAAQQAVNAAVSAWNSLSGQGTQTKQQAAFQWWSNARLQRWLFNIQTPWALMINMMPESIIPVQAEDSNSLTDFFITFKEMRFANSTTSTPLVEDGRAGLSLAPQVNNGNVTPSSSLSLYAEFQNQGFSLGNLSS